MVQMEGKNAGDLQQDTFVSMRGIALANKIKVMHYTRWLLSGIRSLIRLDRNDIFRL